MHVCSSHINLIIQWAKGQRLMAHIIQREIRWHLNLKTIQCFPFHLQCCQMTAYKMTYSCNRNGTRKGKEQLSHAPSWHGSGWESREKCLFSEHCKVSFLDHWISGSGIAQQLQRLGHRLHDEGIEVQFPEGAKDVLFFFLLHSIQTGSRAHTGSYPVSTGGSFPRCKVAGAWSWSIISILCQG
jgi:hypothetical protein